MSFIFTFLMCFLVIIPSLGLCEVSKDTSQYKHNDKISSNNQKYNSQTDNAKGQIDKMDFWQSKKKGANIFNKNIKQDDIKAAKSFGIDFIRIAPDKFVSVKKDFLIGNTNRYQKLIAEDLEKLLSVLDICYEEKMRVVLTMLSLPGSRWKQNNDDKDDLAIWIDDNLQKQAIRFWQDLARILQKHPAIVGINILNEPHPERLYDKSSIAIHRVQQEEVQKQLFNFYKQTIKAIRDIGCNLPIILDSSAYGDPQAFNTLLPHDDNGILYSFHMYEPYDYTNIKINNGKFSYPGLINNKVWNKETLRNYMLPVVDFCKKHNIPHNKILVGEFGANRHSKGVNQYFSDLIDIFQENEWHYAFYSFREDTWPEMDYELGNSKLPINYWENLKNGLQPKLNRNGNNIIFQTLLR